MNNSITESICIYSHTWVIIAWIQNLRIDKSLPYNFKGSILLCSFVSGIATEKSKAFWFIIFCLWFICLFFHRKLWNVHVILIFLQFHNYVPWHRCFFIHLLDIVLIVKTQGLQLWKNILLFYKSFLSSYNFTNLLFAIFYYYISYYIFYFIVLYSGWFPFTSQNLY